MTDNRKSKLLDQVRQIIRIKHYSLRTEESYINWIKRFIFFHNKKHPIEMGEEEIGQFITYLAKNKKVSASTQNQALCAVVFLYKNVLKKEEIHEKDLKNGYGSVYLPYAIERKYPNVKYEWGWQYVFPATKISTDPGSGIQRRHHLYDTVIQKAVKQAVRNAGIVKYLD
jgi:integrase